MKALFLLLLTASLLVAAEPNREAGLSVHMLPDRVAKIGGEHGGFTVTDPTTKARLNRAPYWLALYSHESGAGPIFPAPGTPQGLLDQYRVWRGWTLWQYGGVDWEGGRSRPKVYAHGRYQFSPYLGNMDRPLERNVFNGSASALASFWQRHGLGLR